MTNTNKWEQSKYGVIPVTLQCYGKMQNRAQSVNHNTEKLTTVKVLLKDC